MNIFYRPQYQSEATQFLNKLKETTPGMAARQLEGRALLWDQPLNREALSEFKAARVAQKPYVYQTAPHD
ncbi:DUF3460 family protein [Rhodoferax sp.]|uniref:DUF3460 family protein n=1 Tax=Rhodoferax sp. TaxID=50421 RepID=UPI00262EE7F3|nr:DUF3460 family protein [Rhodoferax sp.]MDD2809991.1 DUF3460 family protein [Rhodoferax sp.]MDD4943727.1 DUF3460 family protein [Rhodoferax sp.]MDD5478286.1 DUF3460 family protein [Rhodoferax sp.]